jgi:hypothetical protein
MDEKARRNLHASHTLGCSVNKTFCFLPAVISPEAVISTAHFAEFATCKNDVTICTDKSEPVQFYFSSAAEVVPEAKTAVVK